MDESGLAVYSSCPLPARGACKTDAQALASVKLLQQAGADILARNKRGLDTATTWSMSAKASQ